MIVNAGAAPAIERGLQPWHRLWLMYRPFLAALLLAALCGCAARKPIALRSNATTPLTQGPVSSGPQVVDDHVPDFATRPYEPFSREDAVQIAVREWRLFGEPVDDDPPDSRPPPLPEDKPERMPGLWERVGEYWWIGQDPGEREASWTGMHDENGIVFPADVDGNFAWSAAFISYIMRIDGAGNRFPYSPNHSTYINAAVSGTAPGLQARRVDSYAPMPGDLICTGRGRSAALRFEDLPTAYSFPGHCGIVVNAQPGMLTIIGGNVDDAVTVTHVPVTPDGMLATPDGRVLDTRYPWLVVLKVLYDR